MKINKPKIKKAKSLLIVNKRFHISNAFDIRRCSCIEYTLFTKIKPMEPKIFTEAERGNLGRIHIYHTGEFTHTDIARQVVHCLNDKGYEVYIKSDSFDLGAHVGNGVMSPSVNVCPVDRPGMGFGPHGYMYGTTVINSGFAEVSHPGIRQSLIDHFQGLETKASASA